MGRIGLSLFSLSLFFLTPFLSWAQPAKVHSNPSMVVEAEGLACMGLKLSRDETRKLAFSNAKQDALDKTQAYLASYSKVESGTLYKDVIEAYSKATIKILQALEEGWVGSDPSTGIVDNCYKVRIKAEAIPNQNDMENFIASSGMISDPTAPLMLLLWTDKARYRLGENLKFYFQSNKPFFAKAVYHDSLGNMIEVTPYDRPKYYKGGVVYQIPSAEDEFTLRITPPLGKEKLVLYASTKPFGNYEGLSVESFYVLRGNCDLGDTTRGLTVLQEKQDQHSDKAEFAEASALVQVER